MASTEYSTCWPTTTVSDSVCTNRVSQKLIWVMGFQMLEIKMDNIQQINDAVQQDTSGYDATGQICQNQNKNQFATTM